MVYKKLQRSLNRNQGNDINILRVLLLTIVIQNVYTSQSFTTTLRQMKLQPILQHIDYRLSRNSVISCYEACATCTSSSPYSCTSCKQGFTPYVFSCQDLSVSQQSPVIIVFCVLTTTLFLFMILLGYGVYRQLFQSIQIASLISWGYQSSMGSYPLQGTNLGLQYNNSFWQSFSPQFIILMAIWVAFWVAVLIAYRYPSRPISVLLMRKQTIFPVRLFMFFYNIILYTALIDVTTKKDGNQLSQDLFGYILAILAIIKILVVLAMMIFACNWKRIKPDDPTNYVFLEKIRGTRWWVRNHTIFSMLTKTTIILAYIIGFTSPLIAGIIMLVAQGTFIVYFSFLIRFKQIRYFVFNLIGMILLELILISSFTCAISDIQSQVWYIFRTCYFVFNVALCSTFLFSGLIQVTIYRSAIRKQIVSLFKRFVFCQQINKEVEKNKFDQTYGRQKVTHFKENLLHKQKLTQLQPFPEENLHKKGEIVLKVINTQSRGNERQ